MSVAVGHDEDLHIPRENCPALPFVEADYGWFAGQMPLIRRVFAAALRLNRERIIQAKWRRILM
jgi:hypothetical protein